MPPVVRPWRGSPRRTTGLLVAVLVTLLACTPQAPATDLDHAVAREAATQAPDMVDVTLYFRHGRGTEAYLVPVVREVPIGSDLPRTALDLTLQGPTEQDAPGLHPALPPTTTVRGFAVNDTTASVDLSDEVVSEADEVGNRPEHELLALAAVANTLTEFPEITRVALTVDGEAGGRFWGGWGLPPVLFRDDSVIGSETTSPSIPALESFTGRAQRVGEPRRPRAVVSSVRIRPRSTYLRVTLELAEPDGSDLLGPVPDAKAVRDGDEINVSLTAEAAAGIAGAQVVDDPLFDHARVAVREAPPSVSVSVQPRRAADFALRTLTDPSRVVLDIRR